MDGLTTREVAALAGLTVGSLRGTLSRIRAAGGDDMQLPREQWPDGRTPLYDKAKVKAWVEGRK